MDVITDLVSFLPEITASFFPLYIQSISLFHVFSFFQMLLPIYYAYFPLSKDRLLFSIRGVRLNFFQLSRKNHCLRNITICCFPAWFLPQQYLLHLPLKLYLLNSLIKRCEILLNLYFLCYYHRSQVYVSMKVSSAYSKNLFYLQAP